MSSHQIIAPHPTPQAHNQVLVECIDACYDCTHACMSCADACLAEHNPGALIHCIQTDWNCADVCNITARLMARQTDANLGLLAAQVECCRKACEICARECEHHGGDYQHCALCAETCYACAERCRELLKAL